MDDPMDLVTWIVIGVSNIRETPCTFENFLTVPTALMSGMHKLLQIGPPPWIRSYSESNNCCTDRFFRIKWFTLLICIVLFVCLRVSFCIVNLLRIAFLVLLSCVNVVHFDVLYLPLKFIGRGLKHLVSSFNFFLYRKMSKPYNKELISFSQSSCTDTLLLSK